MNDEETAEVVTEHYETLVKFIKKRVEFHEDARDIAHQSVLKVWRTRGSLETRTHARNSLFRAAKSELKNRYRTKDRDIMRQITGSGEMSAREVERKVFSEEPEIDRWTLMEMVARDEMDEMSEDRVKVLMEYEIEGLSTQEIADKRGVSRNAAKSKLYRARERLKTRVQEGWEDGRK